VLAFRVVGELDILEHVPSGVVAGRVGPAPDTFPLQKLEEALGDGVVVAIAAPAHAGSQIVQA
jgi:hypothetical protein